jgi:hypothetical protein
MCGLKLHFTHCFIWACNTKEIMQIDDVSEKGNENKFVNQEEKVRII